MPLERDPSTQTQSKTRSRRKRAYVLLALPYLALLFPQIYARNTPVLWGFPFFYWYQLLWVLLGSAVLGIVYRLLREQS